VDRSERQGKHDRGQADRARPRDHPIASLIGLRKTASEKGTPMASEIMTTAETR
jgi:hypothetical protein